MIYLKKLLPLLALPALALAQSPPPAGLAAASPLPRLLAERRVLTGQYATARAQRHALFGLSGKPSKQDWQEVAGALQGIVDKDEEIVAVLNQTAQQAQTSAATLQSTSRDDRNLSTQRFAELQNDLLNAQQRERQAATRQQAMAADLAEAQQSRTTRDLLIAGLAVLSVGLLFWRRRR